MMLTASTREGASYFKQLKDDDPKELKKPAYYSQHNRHDMSLLQFKSKPKDTSHQVVRNKLVKRYNKYYAHWKDLNVLVAFLAILGLIIEFRVWEVTFSDRFSPDYFTSAKNNNISNFSETFVMITTAMALVCLFFKHYTAQIWADYPNPVKFYKQVVRE